MYRPSIENLRLKLGPLDPAVLADNHPTPFAGKYPTRLAWYWRLGKTALSYLGKPHPHAIQEFNRLRKLSADESWAMEFDREHIIWRTSLEYKCQTHPSLFACYHLWSAAYPDGIHLASFFLHRFEGFQVYTPFKHPGSAGATWRDCMRTIISAKYRPRLKTPSTKASVAYYYTTSIPSAFDWSVR